MAAGKGGLLAILAGPKGSAKPGESADDEAPSSSREPVNDDTAETRAAQDLIDAVNSGDAKGVYDAIARCVKLCDGGETDEAM